MKKKLFFLMLFSIWELSIFSQNWQHVGPIKDNNPANLFETGKVDCLMPHNGYNGTSNQKIYLGSRPGGLWYTTNLGSSWTSWATPNSIPYHGICALEMRPAPSPMMLVSTVNELNNIVPGGNTYILNTSSNTWTPTDLSTVSPGCVVRDIGIFPGDTTVVFIAASTGLFYSTNSGLNWSLKRVGNFDKIAFVNVLTSIGNYKVFVSGENDIAFSVNKGVSFTQHAGLMSTIGPLYYADMDVTTNGSGQQLLYIDALIGSNHNIHRVQITPSTGAEVLAFGGAIYDLAASTDRMGVAAQDQMVYFGSGGICKYSFTTALFYTPPASGQDIATSGVSYGNWTGNTHSDLKDLKIIPSLNQLLLVCDGGFYYDSYTPNGNGTCGNTWVTANNQLNISQIWGLSCSEIDPDKYFTGEQDTKAFLVSGAINTTTGYGTEPSNILIDRNDDANFMYSVAASSNNLSGVFNATPFSTAATTYWETPTGTNFCNPANSWNFPSAEFGTNTLFQDPNHVYRGVYYGIKGGVLQEYCPATSKFMGKAFIPGAQWEQFVNSIAFSKGNKDKVYVTITNRNFISSTYTDTCPAKVFAYTGANFDDSWAGHNDTWVNISPAHTDPVFTTPLSYPSAYQIEYMGVVASDWYPDKIFLAIKNVPGNPNTKVLCRNGGVWIDYSAGIPTDEYAVSLVYEQGTNDQMYLGTNLNVYYRNAYMSQWMPFSGTLPNLQMMQLRVNYTENSLRVGTFGRGMWKSDFVCPALNSLLLSSSFVNTDAFFEAQSNLTAQNYTVVNGSVKFRAGDYIELLPNFEVTANATTNFFAFIHRCAGTGNTFRLGEQDENSELTMEEVMEIYKEQKETAFTIYPNPSNGILNFEFEIEENQIGKIVITDVVGKQIQVITITGEQHNATADLNGYTGGIYFISLYENEKLIKTQKAIINH